jgi:molecular chaperone GrpE
VSEREAASGAAPESTAERAARDEAAQDFALLEARLQELEAERDALRREREDARRERDEMQERVARLTAEFQNFRRRSETQVEDQVRLRLEGLISNLVHVLDAMDAAFGSTASSLGHDKAALAVLEGFEQIRSLLGSVLASVGLQKLEVVGKPYDPRQHEALMTVESADHPPETVIAELRPGYLLRERVLRAAQVTVSKAPAKQS